MELADDPKGGQSTVRIDTRGGPIYARVWHMAVGR